MCLRLPLHLPPGGGAAAAAEERPAPAASGGGSLRGEQPARERHPGPERQPVLPEGPAP